MRLPEITNPVALECRECHARYPVEPGQQIEVATRGLGRRPPSHCRVRRSRCQVVSLVPQSMQAETLAFSG